jgi:hypothetical protein
MPRSLASVSLRPTRGKLGIGENAERNLPPGCHPVTACRMFPHNAEVIEGNMSKIWAARAIPHGPDAGDPCFKTLIHFDVTS